MTLDDLFIEMLRNLDELIESALVEEHDPNYLTSEQLTSREREYVWEFMAKAKAAS